MRIFLDTNVLVSAFGTRGLCADVLREVLSAHELLVGEVVLEELERALMRSFGVPASTVQSIGDLLRQYEVISHPVAPAAIDLRDPDDAWIVASAIDGRADLLVTGDQELLSLDTVGQLRIVSPRGLWELLREGEK